MILSVLDQSPIPEGASGGTALANSIDLAQLTESLGYHRYWVAEHHGSPALAGAAPEVLLAAIGAATKSIRIGSGGVMLPHYSPLKVAETFSLLAGLHPGRIDLGLGRAPGSDQRTAFALQRDRRQNSPNDFPNQLAELIGYFDDSLPADHPFAALAQTLPGRPELPDVWLLGSSPDSAGWAAETGLPYCVADFINGRGAPLAERYRRAFKPSARLTTPYVMTALWTVCADSDAEAERLASSARMMMAHLAMGRSIPVPTPERALAWLADHPQNPEGGRRVIAGSPAKVRAGIEAAVAEYGADEAMLVNILHDHGARRRSYELVAKAFCDHAAAA
jgi:luciferase family oxidoreductase group 1